RRLDSYLNTKRYSKVSLEIVWRSKRTTKMPSIIRLITRKGTSRLSICWKNWPEATRIQSKDTWLRPLGSTSSVPNIKGIRRKISVKQSGIRIDLKNGWRTNNDEQSTDYLRYFGG